MKKLVLLLFTVYLLVLFTGCNPPYLGGKSGGGGGNGSLASGNWAFSTSGGINGPLNMGGYLTSSNNAVAGHLFVAGQSGSGFTVASSTAPMAVTGTLSNGTLVMTGVLASSTFKLTFTGLSTATGSITSLPTGTYTVVGGTDAGDSGSITGTIAGDVSGTWAGTDSTTGGTVTVSMSQASTPDPTKGNFALTSTGTGVTLTGATGAGCVATGTLDSTSFVAGNITFLSLSTTDGGIPGTATILEIASPSDAPTSLLGGGYIYTGGSGCVLQNTSTLQTLTMTKQ